MPRLVGCGPDGRRVKFEFASHGPYVELIGGRGAGKTAVLEHLRDAYSQRIPQAHADLGAANLGMAGLAPFAPGTAPNASAVTDLLYYLEYQLHQRFRGATWRPKPLAPPPLRCPRLVYGLLAVTAWRVGDDKVPAPDLLAARAALAQLFIDSQPTPAARQALVNSLTSTVATMVTGLVGVPAPIDEVVKPLIETVGNRLLSPRLRRRAIGWWGGRKLNAVGDSWAQLTALSLNFRAGGPSRERAERHLVAALLADVRDYYGWWRRFNDDPGPLLLLDNAHTELGTLFLKLLCQAQHETIETTPDARTQPPDTRTQPVVVAAALGDENAHTPVGSVTETSGWTRPSTAGAPESWLLRLGLRPLTADHVMEMLIEARADSALSTPVTELSDGRPAVVAGLVAAATGREHGEPDLGALLGLGEGEPRTTVCSRLLDGLLPDPLARQRLTFFAAALDTPAAQHLSVAFPRGDGGVLPVPATLTYLRADHWSGGRRQGDDQAFVADRTLRVLLLHELRAAGPGVWAQVHRRLRSFYEDGGAASAERTVRGLHHALALGDRENVTRGLHRLFVKDHARPWLDALKLICAAPLPPDGLTPPRKPQDGCPTCAEHAPQAHQTHHAIGRLVDALWRQSAPAAVPRADRIDLVALQLTILATGSENDCCQDVLYRAHLTWPGELRRWRRAPDLTIPQGGDR
ncbi:hypothetical protein HII36_31640 [Nonomuraea sp. NN258]|uniref:hypothetical protein n=1 Tax=Nonomuraea antri TaxID=2730852 RepID=UPI001569891E|nr:hypothetical protein [Nonomuraea antri]NRQ36355.1 hypothetical protein [Nonomuraea antri]